jgi:hypothetical protein
MRSEELSKVAGQEMALIVDLKTGGKLKSYLFTPPGVPAG